LPVSLSIDDARGLVLEAVQALEPEEVALGDALDRVLAEAVVAPADVPGFDNSAMDGFAVRPAAEGTRLRVIGESRAGAPFAGPVGPGEAVAISTGAQVPAGAEAVLQIERVRQEDGEIVLGDDVAAGRNIRRSGDDVRAGATVLEPGAVLGPAELGVAAVVGRATLRCARRPRVAVLATGDELVEPGAALGPGQLHDSNSLALAALARRAGADVVSRGRVGDTREATRSAIAAALDEADVVLLSGGVSVGPHDHVKPALLALGVREVFWRVALRPGRPTWFGSQGDTLVFGLPGNPVSAMVTFLLFARPALRALQGADAAVPRRRVTLAEAIPRHPDRDECVRVRLDDAGRAHLTGPQGSHVLTSMLGADGLGVIPRGDGEVAAGGEIDFEPLP
jgi:molybdopterin molybdotransferase